MDRQRLLTATLRTAPWGATVASVLAAALAAVEPAAAVQRYLQRSGSVLDLDEASYDLREYERVFVVGAGKAGAPMARAVAEIVGPHLTAGIIIVKDEQQPLPELPAPLTLLAAGHPLPDMRGVEATRRITALLEQATERDLVLVLISGGGSALLTQPAPGISLDDLQQLTSLLLGSGASIHEINTLRKHLDEIKGGGLARQAFPATVATLILSDVVGNALNVIASGPTVPDATTYADAYAVLELYHLLTETPPAIRAHLEAGLRGERDETPKADAPIFARTQHVLVGSNQQAAAAAVQAAHEAGFHTLLLTTAAQGEARVVGRLLAGIARELVTTGCTGGVYPSPLAPPACLILGGETTVTLRGRGTGGRNQELALAAVRELAGLDDVVLITLATDGGDGPTDAAGAVVTGATLARAQALGLDPDDALAHNDAYPFFAALDDLLRPGPTHTNVNDMAFVFVW